MIDIRPFETLGAANHGWLDAHHHFSFADYYDPARMNWGPIRVWNDDTIAPGSGFAPHSHRDMEIITYVRTGAITHKDSLGNVGRTAAGDVQVMGAGSGVTHSEYNLESEETTLFQIWVHPRAPGGNPHWGEKQFPKADRASDWVVLASGYDDEGALPINADARVLGATVQAGATLSYDVEVGRIAYIVPASGQIRVNGVAAGARDGIALDGGETYEFVAIEDAELVMVEGRP
ncbi:MAG: pirin family protein [Sphingomonadaceae bacterium]